MGGFRVGRLSPVISREIICLVCGRIYGWSLSPVISREIICLVCRQIYGWSLSPVILGDDTCAASCVGGQRIRSTNVSAGGEADMTACLADLINEGRLQTFSMSGVTTSVSSICAHNRIAFR